MIDWTPGWPVPLELVVVVGSNGVLLAVMKYTPTPAMIIMTTIATAAAVLLTARVDDQFIRINRRVTFTIGI